jgi:homoserine O-acetyltransferase
VKFKLGKEKRIDLNYSVGYVKTSFVTFEEGIELECNKELKPISIAYQTYGKLNEDKSNAVLVGHALSGDAHAAGYDEETGKEGWWNIMIGPGKGIDTNKYFVICSNVLGGCKGTTGPASINPETGKEYGLDFPPVSVLDMVKLQKKLTNHLGIDKLLCVIGGSMGGMQALQWSVAFPESVYSCCAIATTTTLSPQSIAFNEIGRLAILQDPNFNEGRYYGKNIPASGLALARMIGHITYLSDESMHAKFGRSVKDQRTGEFLKPEFEVESYLHYQGDAFIKRFDANTYLYLTKAMDYFELASKTKSLKKAFSKSASRYLVVSFTSDWLFPVYQSKEIVRALKSNLIDVTYCEIESSYGHDAFLLEVEELTRIISNFLKHSQAEINKNKGENGRTI